jgi:hypothetical protein
MKVVFDTSVIALILNQNAKPPQNPTTHAPLENARQRVDYLVRVLSKKKSKIIIPAPVLCEVLTHADAAINDYMKRLHQAPFLVHPFDSRAAIECAQYLRKHGLKSKDTGNTRTKIKFDWQIMSIAQISGAETVYSDDRDIFKYGQKAGITVVRSFELELDPDSRQLDLALPLTETEPQPHLPTSGSS